MFITWNQIYALCMMQFQEIFLTVYRYWIIYSSLNKVIMRVCQKSLQTTNTKEIPWQMVTKKHSIRYLKHEAKYIAPSLRRNPLSSIHPVPFQISLGNRDEHDTTYGAISNYRCYWRNIYRTNEADTASLKS